jgi:predicted phage terminase large subunit-like protein
MIITGIEKDPDLALLKAKMLGSLLFFIQNFFKLKTGRDFLLSSPVGRESHYITVCRELHNIFYLRKNRLLINVPPGHGKSTMLIYFMSWAFAHYPDCHFIYVSYSHDLASKHTSELKDIMMMPEYQKFFGVKIRQDSSAKDNFQTDGGGAVKAFGSNGSITGQNAGLPGCDRFSGCVLLDDMHKPSEVHSDTIRLSVIDNYSQTIKPRPRADNVAIVGIGHSLHSDDLFAFLRRNGDGQNWDKVILKALDDNGNVLAPNIISRDRLLIEKEHNSYVFWSQYQQDPKPAGGGIFKPGSFELLDKEPRMLCTFLTVDTAETDKTYNDPSVFSFWGLYEIEHYDRPSGIYALHWIDCIQKWLTPDLLENELLSFYAKCCSYSKPPSFIAIEKKTTGVTLISTLSKLRGLTVRDIERTRASGNKTTRFLEAQPYQSQKRISFPAGGSHVQMCRDHCAAITDNDTHAHDDIADTMYDAIKIGLINPALVHQFALKTDENRVVLDLAQQFNRVGQLRAKAWHA